METMAKKYVDSLPMHEIAKALITKGGTAKPGSDAASAVHDWKSGVTTVVLVDGSKLRLKAGSWAEVFFG